LAFTAAWVERKKMQVPETTQRVIQDVEDRQLRADLESLHRDMYKALGKHLRELFFVTPLTWPIVIAIYGKIMVTNAFETLGFTSPRGTKSRRAPVTA